MCPLLAQQPPSWLSSVADKFTKGKKKKKPVVQVGFVPGGEGKIAKHFGIDGSSSVLLGLSCLHGSTESLMMSILS